MQFVGAREELVLLLLCLAVSRICVKPHVHMQKEAPCTRLDGRFQVSGVGVPTPESYTPWVGWVGGLVGGQCAGCQLVAVWEP